jgi:hypothetical protein
MTGAPSISIGTSVPFLAIFLFAALMFLPILLVGFVALLFLGLISPIGFICGKIMRNKLFFAIFQMLLVAGFGADIIADSVFIIFGIIDSTKGADWIFVLTRIGIYAYSIAASFGVGIIWKHYVSCTDSQFVVEDALLKKENILWAEALVMGLVYRVVILLRTLNVFLIYMKSPCKAKEICLEAFDPDQDHELSGNLSYMASDFIFCSFPLAIIAAWQYSVNASFPPNDIWIMIKCAGFILGSIQFSYFVYAQQFDIFNNCMTPENNLKIFSFDREIPESEMPNFYRNMSQKIKINSPKK